jgi:hypothetical protein
MKRLFSAKTIAVAAVALGAVGAASAAHARSDVVFSIGLNAAPYGYVEPAPVYVQPQPVYVQPGPAYYGPNYAWQEREREREWAWRHRHYAHRHGPWGDYDHDGVPNRYDRAPANPYRR